jgi:hypothetical protein
MPRIRLPDSSRMTVRGALVAAAIVGGLALAILSCTSAARPMPLQDQPTPEAAVRDDASTPQDGGSDATTTRDAKLPDVGPDSTPWCERCVAAGGWCGDSQCSFDCVTSRCSSTLCPTVWCNYFCTNVGGLSCENGMCVGPVYATEAGATPCTEIEAGVYIGGGAEKCSACAVLITATTGLTVVCPSSPDAC